MIERAVGEASTDRGRYRYAASIYASRETPAVLEETVLCALRAAAGARSVVDVLVNGNAQLAVALADGGRCATAVPAGVRLRIWAIALGDKAFTWNEYVHQIAPVADCNVFVDGYARVRPGAFMSLARALDNAPSALAATGAPRSGLSARHSAKAMRQEGGLQGNLYALNSKAMAELQRIGFRLPVGLYRTDSTLGAALAFGLNLFDRGWSSRERILLVDGATWDVTALRWHKLADLRTWLRRRRRQAQGLIENAAVRQRYAVERLAFESLPRTAAELIQQWMASASSTDSPVLKRHAELARTLAAARAADDRADIPHRCLLDREGEQAAAALASLR